MSSELTDRIAAAMRQVIAQAVLTNERIARTVGLNVVDLQTFGVLMYAGRPLSAGEISSRTELPTSTTTRVIDRLEQAGFVRRVADPADRRKVVVEVVAESLARISASYAVILDEMRDLHAGFTDDELAVIARYLEAMVGASITGTSSPRSDRAPV